MLFFFLRILIKTQPERSRSRSRTSNNATKGMQPNNMSEEQMLALALKRSREGMSTKKEPVQTQPMNLENSSGFSFLSSDAPSDAPPSTGFSFIGGDDPAPNSGGDQDSGFSFLNSGAAAQDS